MGEATIASFLSSSYEPPNVATFDIPTSVLSTPLLLSEHTYMFTPFLEESHRKIFSRKIFVYPDALKYGVTQMKNKQRQQGYINLRKLGGAHNQKRIKRDFVSVLDVTIKKHGRYTFLEFIVTIFHGSKFHTFWEGDFDSIDLEDLLACIQDLRKNNMLRPRDWMNGLEALKRYIRHAINLACMEDLQIGLENKYEKINLQAPDLSFPDRENLPTYTAINTHE